MKPLFSAILETIVLVVSTLIILLGTAIFKYESPYLNYSETHPDSTITLGEVLGYVSEETDTPKEAAAEAAKKIFGKNTEKVLPLAVGKILCIEVGERTASVLEFYTFIVFLESIICLIFGITLPCSLYRHLDPAKAIDNAFVNKNYVYVDNLGHTKGYVGETRAWLVKILLLFLMLFVANVWCTFLPIFIVINFAVGLVMAILRIVGITTSNAAAKAKMKLAAGKDTACKYRVVVENDLFSVAGDVYPNRSLYFKKYWNAVVAQRILECDRDGRLYTNDDALNTITYGDENVHKQYKTIRRINKIKLLFSSASRKNAKKFKNEVTTMDYTFTFVDRAGARGEYIILSKCSNKYMLFRDAMNCSLAMDLLKYDSENKEFDMIAWGSWERLIESDKQKFLVSFNGKTAPPQGEGPSAMVGCNVSSAQSDIS